MFYFRSCISLSSEIPFTRNTTSFLSPRTKFLRYATRQFSPMLFHHRASFSLRRKSNLNILFIERARENSAFPSPNKYRTRHILSNKRIEIVSFVHHSPIFHWEPCHTRYPEIFLPRIVGKNWPSGTSPPGLILEFFPPLWFTSQGRKSEAIPLSRGLIISFIRFGKKGVVKGGNSSPRKFAHRGSINLRGSNRSAGHVSLEECQGPGFL